MYLKSHEPVRVSGRQLAEAMGIPQPPRRTLDSLDRKQIIRSSREGEYWLDDAFSQLLDGTLDSAYAEINPARSQTVRQATPRPLRHRGALAGAVSVFSTILRILIFIALIGVVAVAGLIALGIWISTKKGALP